MSSYTTPKENFLLLERRGAFGVAGYKGGGGVGVGFLCIRWEGVEKNFRGGGGLNLHG